jgi:hypothetical protein
MNGLELAFQWSMYSRICLIRTVTEVNVPRRMDWRVMMPNQVSIWLIQDEPSARTLVESCPTPGSRLRRNQATYSRHRET